MTAKCWWKTSPTPRLGYAALRVLRQRVETICFVTGHGETFLLAATGLDAEMRVLRKLIARLSP
ncbi:MAG: hypothetical protein WBF73_29670 [Bradyrhizobium sp.]